MEVSQKVPESPQDQRSLISIIAANQKGMLAAFTKTISDFGYNIESLTISATDISNSMHRTTAYVSGYRTSVDALCDSLRKIDGVSKVLNFIANEGYIERELCLVKTLSGNNPKIGELASVASRYDARIIYSQENLMIFEYSADSEKVTEFLTEMSKIDKVELLRSGLTATSLDKEILSYF